MKSTRRNDYFIEYLFSVITVSVMNIKLSYGTFMNNMKINSKFLLQNILLKLINSVGGTKIREWV